MKALLKPQPGCAPRTSTDRPSGDATRWCRCCSGEAVKRSVASIARRLRPRCSTSRHSRTLNSCARRDPYRLGVSHHCCRGSRAGCGTGSSSSVAGTGDLMSASRSMGCTSTHGKPNSFAEAPSFSSAGAYADDATVATTVLLVAQRPTCDHPIAGIRPQMSRTQVCRRIKMVYARRRWKSFSRHTIRHSV